MNPLLLLAVPALLADEPAVDRSVDTQLLHPALSANAALGVDSARAGEAGVLTLGASCQLEQQPLRYSSVSGGSGAAIAQRGTLHAGLSLAASERATVFLRGSVARLEGGDLDLVAPAQGTALGDLALGVKAAWLERGPVALGPMVTLWLPTGSAESWVAERSLRYAPALLASLGNERVELLGQLGLLARVEVDSGADFVASPELFTGTAVVAHATPWLGGVVELGSRHGLLHFLEPGAENPVELRAGLRLASQRWGRVDLLAGRGLSEGYGTSELRLGLAVLAQPRRRRPEPVMASAPPPPPPVVVAAPPEPEPAVEETSARRAWVERGRILVDAPIAFEPGTARLTPASEALLPEVAAVVNAYPQIELLVLEGHAREPGGAGADYALSLARARVVFEGLVGSAVRPERLAYRGMGSAAEAEDGRYVDLLISKVRPLQEGPPPTDRSPLLLPWSGEALAAPELGGKLLGQDGHPILEREPVPTATELEDLPTEDSFRDALDEEEPP